MMIVIVNTGIAQSAIIAKTITIAGVITPFAKIPSMSMSLAVHLVWFTTVPAEAPAGMVTATQTGSFKESAKVYKGVVKAALPAPPFFQIVTRPDLSRTRPNQVFEPLIPPNDALLLLSA